MRKERERQAKRGGIGLNKPRCTIDKLCSDQFK